MENRITNYVKSTSLLTLSSLGFFWVLSTWGGGGGADSPTHRNFFAISANQMKFCTIVNWYELYILVV